MIGTNYEKSTKLRTKIKIQAIIYFVVPQKDKHSMVGSIRSLPVESNLSKTTIECSCKYTVRLHPFAYHPGTT